MNTWTLSSIVSEICLRAGLTYKNVDVRNLDGNVDGFHVNCDYPSYAAIEALAKIFFFDVSSFDKKVNFIPRGLDTVANITIADLIDNGTDITKANRKDGIEVPRVYNLEYYDIDGGLQPDKQTSDRSLDARSKSEVRLETIVLMDADTAAQKVVINHKLAIEEQRGFKEFSLPDSWLKLTPGNVINLDGERLRITEIEIDDGFQNYKATYDRQSAYLSYITGVAVNTPAQSPSLVVGDTVLQFVDSHIIKDSDDKLGYYVGIAGTTDTWSGASIELSKDGGSSYPEMLNSSISSVMGTLAAVLPSHNKNYPDDRNTLTITMTNSSFEVYPVTLAGMMNRSNLAIVGDEIINFADAVEISDGVWELSNLLRGRKGTTATSHAIGERFMLLNRQSLAFIETDLYEINQPLTFRATSYGASSGTEQTLTFTGQSQKEKAPGYLRAVRSAGNIIISWQGCGKLGASVNVGMGLYFTGYRVTVNGVSQDTTSETLTITDPGGAVTISVQQINSITGLGPAVTI